MRPRVFFDPLCSVPEFKAARAGRPRVGYYAFRLHCPRALRLDLGLGYDGPLKVWVDGAVRFLDPRGAPPASGRKTIDKAVVPLDLGRGRHAVLAALVADRTLAPGLRVRLAPRGPRKRRPSA